MDVFGKHLTKILKEMCKRVGADFNSINFKEDSWFRLYSWTKTKEEDFQKWLENYLYKNSDARKELMEHPRKTKTEINKLAGEFIFMYGWVYSKEEK